MLNAFSKTVDRLRAGLAHGVDVFISEPEIVVFRQRWISVRVGEDHMVIDHIRIGPTAVVQARKRDPQFFLFLYHVEYPPRRQRPLVDAVERGG